MRIATFSHNGREGVGIVENDRIFDLAAVRSSAPQSVRELIASGCCGMAGTFGHEARHRPTSERIYALSWQEKVAAHSKEGRLLATGYSCRFQVKIIDGVDLRHPVQALRTALIGSPA